MRWRRRDAREQHLPLRAANKPPHEANLRRLSQFPSPPPPQPVLFFPISPRSPKPAAKFRFCFRRPAAGKTTPTFRGLSPPPSGKRKELGGVRGPTPGSTPHILGQKTPQLPAPPLTPPPSTALPGAAACLRAMEKGGGKRKVCPPRGRRHSPPWPRRCPG